MILTLKRDDGEQLALSMANGYSTEATDDWFSAKPLTNSTINYANADGGALIKQNYGMWPITVSGKVHGNDVGTIRERTQRLARFLLKNHYYSAIFTSCDGSQMAAHEVFVSTALAAPMMGKSELARRYSFQITLSDPYLYEYATDDSGNEVYAHSIKLRRFTPGDGGYVYQTAGYVYYKGGYAYVGQSALPAPIMVDSIKDVNPIWRIPGPATNPTITNLANNASASIELTIAAGQELVVDNKEQTAYIGTADFTDHVVGEWFTLSPGSNSIKFETEDSTDLGESTLEWNEVVL